MTGPGHPLSAAFVVGPGLLVPATGRGVLQGRRLAVKDVYDVAGVPTGAGNPTWAATHPVPSETAPALRRLLDAGVELVGKTVTDELAFSLAGTNVHHGTPPNPAAPGRVPGGSSSGSASAVAAGAADIGLGTDTAGSVRVPASYCGLVGVRPSWGRVPLGGCVPLAPGYDTAGWLTATAELAAEVARVLLDPWPCPPPRRPATVVVAGDAFDLVDPEVRACLEPAVDRLTSLVGSRRDEVLAAEGLEGWAGAFRIDQAHQVWRVHGDWITATSPVFGPGVAARFGWAATVTEDDVAATAALRASARRRLDAVLDGAVVCLPAACGPAPDPDLGAGAKETLRSRTVALSCPAGLAGAPSVSVPVARVAGGPVGLALLGARGTDEALLALAVRLMARRRR